MIRYPVLKVYKRKENRVIEVKRRLTTRKKPQHTGQLYLPEPDPNTGKPLSLNSCIIYILIMVLNTFDIFDILILC